MKAIADGNLFAIPAAPVSGSAKSSLRMVLRSATAIDHEAVDAAFGRFDLTVAASYAQFLTAHARVLGPVEGAVAGLWPSWSARSPLLEADLTELGVAVPENEKLTADDDAQRWGMLYVIEGSRLGGGILAGRVAEGLPVRYLSARHEGGSWRHFGDALEQAGEGQGAAWRDAAVAGAKLTFARFAEAAAAPCS